MGFRSWLRNWLRINDEWEKAMTDASDVNAGIRTRNEVRVARGLERLNGAEFDRLSVTTPEGIKYI